jgi:hypothetical protein
VDLEALFGGDFGGHRRAAEKHVNPNRPYTCRLRRPRVLAARIHGKW